MIRVYLLERGFITNLVFDPLQVQEWMLVRIASENFSEEWTAGSQDDFVSGDLRGVVTGQSYVEKVFLLPQVAECCTNVGLKIIPTKAEFF